MTRFPALLLGTILLLLGCGGEDDAGGEPKKGDDTAPKQEDFRKALTDPWLARETAPDTFRAKFETTKGTFVIQATRAWAPEGVDRFYNLVRIGYFTDVAFFRVVKGFVVQFGLHGRPEVNSAWLRSNIAADPVKKSNTRGMVTFAQEAGNPNTRSVQLFINLANNSNLDGMHFSPIAQVVEGMEVVDSLYGGYREQPTQMQQQIAYGGNAFLQKYFPKLDYIKRATLVD